MTCDNVVFLYNNNEQVRIELATRLTEMGLSPIVADNASALFRNVTLPVSPHARCLIVDFDSPLNGFAVHEELARRNTFIPTIYYAENPRTDQTVRAMRMKAIDVVEYTPEHTLLLQAVKNALSYYHSQSDEELQRFSTLDRLKTLSAKEMLVLDGILSGMMNKAMAKSLSISVRTVEQRRSQIFRKMGVGHPAELAKRVFEARRHSASTSTA